MNWCVVDKLIKDALVEDVPDQDITTTSIVGPDSRSRVELIAKEEGIVAGLEVFSRVFQIIGDVEIEYYADDGDRVHCGQVIGRLTGSTRSLLTGERVALNFLQRMSGVATLANEFVERLEGSETKLLDTRKTTPNMRILEKYSVRMGGGCNHRSNLSDGILIKDNHIKAAGGIKKAMDLVRENTSFVRKIEVEVESLEEVNEALEAGADIIMLDNMDRETMRQAVALIHGRAITEASGNITLANIGEVASTGVDYISTGALTHSYRVLDLSMKNLTNI